MQTVIIVVHLMIVTVLIGAVLLQKSEGGGLGMGGNAGGLMTLTASSVSGLPPRFSRCTPNVIEPTACHRPVRRR